MRHWYSIQRNPTRNQVAQLALNALKTPVVEAEDGTFNVTTTVGGATTTITNAKVNYKVTASGDAYARAISDVEASDANTINGIAGAVIELGEKLYDGKLQLRERNVYDEFGRPARKWQYDGKDFGTYAKVENLRKEYTAKVSGKDLYEELGSDIIDSVKKGDQWTLKVTIDGYDVASNRTLLAGAYFSEDSMIRSNTDKVGDTGKGVLTQVFVDSVRHRVDIAIINTYLAKATQNYVAKDEAVKMDIYELDNVRGGWVKTDDQKETITVDGDDLPIEDVKKDDIYLVTLSQGEVMSMVKPEIVADSTINTFKRNSWVKNDDVQYDYSDTAMYDVEVLDEFDDQNMKNLTYNIILDKYGYLIGIEQNEEVNQYAFLTGMDLGNSNLSYKSAQANLIFLDGTMKTVTVNTEKSKPIVPVSVTADWDNDPSTPADARDVPTSVENGNWLNGWVKGATKARVYSQLNTWCTYTVDDSGVYTLFEVGPDSTVGRKEAVTVRKVGQMAQNATAEVKINTKNVSLDGSKAGTDQNYIDFAKVYGNDETAYINVKLKDITDKRGAGNNVKIVEKVDSTTIGIKNVDLTVNNVATDTYTAPTDEIYTLYNKDGYILGVVTLNATDNGASANYAYIIGDTIQEKDLGGSKYEWQLKAIVNGQEVTLTEVGENRQYLDKLDEGLWYELTYDKDGNVNGIKSNPQLSNKSIDFGQAQDQYLNAMSEIQPALNPDGVNNYATSEKTLLLFMNYCTGTPGHYADLSYKLGTLYTDTDQTEGIWLNPNVKTVVLLAGKNHASEFDTVKTYEGREGLEQALEDLYRTKSEFDGFLSAIIEGKNGATTIILDERSGRNAVIENGTDMAVTFRFMDGTTPKGSVTKYITADTTFSPATILAEAGAGVSGYTLVDTAPVKVEYVRRGSITLDYALQAAPTMVVEVTWKYAGGSDIVEVYELAVPAGRTMAFTPDSTKDKNNDVIEVPAGYMIKDGTATSKNIFVTTTDMVKVEFDVVAAVTVQVWENTAEAGDPEDFDWVAHKVDADSKIVDIAANDSANAHVFSKYILADGTEKAIAGTATAKVEAGMKIYQDQYVKLASKTVANTTQPTATGTITVAASITDGVETIGSDGDYIKVGDDVKITAKLTTNETTEDTITGNTNVAITVTTSSGAPSITGGTSTLAGDDLKVPGTSETPDFHNVVFTFKVALPNPLSGLSANIDAFTLTFSA